MMKNSLLVLGGFLLGVVFSTLTSGSYEHMLATQELLLRLIAVMALFGLAVKFCLKPMLDHLKNEYGHKEN